MTRKMYRLVDLYRTKYFYVTYNIDLIYLFDTILKLKEDRDAKYNAGSDLHEQLFEDVKEGKEVVIDLAGARLTSDCITILTQYLRKGIKVTDSQDDVRRNILETNAERLALDTESYELLPKFTNKADVKEYLQSLSRDVTYTIPETHEDLYIPLVILIMLLRPTIKIDLGYRDRMILGKVAGYFTVHELKQYRDFFFVSDEGVMELSPDSSGNYSLQQANGLDIDGVLEYGNLVPKIFGEKRLVTDEPWRCLSTECLRIVDGYKLTYQPTLEEAILGGAEY